MTLAGAQIVNPLLSIWHAEVGCHEPARCAPLLAIPGYRPQIAYPRMLMLTGMVCW